MDVRQSRYRLMLPGIDVPSDLVSVGIEMLRDSLLDLVDAWMTASQQIARSADFIAKCTLVKLTSSLPAPKHALRPLQSLIDRQRQASGSRLCLCSSISRDRRGRGCNTVISLSEE